MHRAPFATWLAQTNDVTQVFLAAGQIPNLVNLAGGLPEPSTWPVPELAALAAKAVSDHPAEALGYSPIDGLPALRDLIAQRFSTPALQLSRDNILITTGGMQALDLIGKVLLEKGGQIAAQSPAYLGALDAWRPSHPQYRTMNLAAANLSDADCDPVAAMTGAQFAYTVPNFSNPTGRLVGTDTRTALIAAAIQTGCWLVEDDPYGTLYYDGTPLSRMISLYAQAHPGPYRGPVIYLGTVSKELAPGLRLGWVIAAPEMITAMTTAKQGSDLCTSGLCQRIVLDAFSSGLMDQILPGILDLYRQRRDALCAAMDQHLSDLFEWQIPSGGMFVWAVAKDPALDTDLLLKTGLDHGVCISPGSVFDPKGQDHRAIRINFTLNPPEKLAEGIRRLAGATRALLQAKAA